MYLIKEKEYAYCDICGKDNTLLCFEIKESITGLGERFKIVKCKNCGLVYI